MVVLVAQRAVAVLLVAPMVAAVGGVFVLVPVMPTVLVAAMVVVARHPQRRNQLRTLLLRWLHGPRHGPGLGPPMSPPAVQWAHAYLGLQQLSVCMLTRSQMQHQRYRRREVPLLRLSRQLVLLQLLQCAHRQCGFLQYWHGLCAIESASGYPAPSQPLAWAPIL